MAGKWTIFVNLKVIFLVKPPFSSGIFMDFPFTLRVSTTTLSAPAPSPRCHEGAKTLWPLRGTRGQGAVAQNGGACEDFDEVTPTSLGGDHQINNHGDTLW